MRRIGIEGTDNVLFRLGRDHIARFPRLPHAEAQLARMARWLPGLATTLPLDVPLPLRHGAPQGDYPFAWSLTRFLPGRPALAGLDQMQAAVALAGTLAALRACRVAPDAPRMDAASRLENRLAGLEAQIPDMAAYADARRLGGLLARFRALPPQTEPRGWTHGDLHPLNLLMRRGKLTAVIDWGTLGLGDPALDLLPAFTVFDAPARDRFLGLLSASPDAVQRARAVAFSKCLRGLPYYAASNPGFHAVLRATLARVLGLG